MIKPPVKVSNSLTAKVIEIRRRIHQHPELSNQEHATQKLVEHELRRGGLENIRHVVGTGLVVDIEGASADKRLVLRADMDALPIQEDRPDLDFASTHDGVMHACGHDAHTAMLLGAAMMLHDMREELQGSVRCVFQPAEETEPLGGRAIVADGVLDDADAALALHIDPEIEAGCIGINDGAMLAGGMEFTLTVQGRSAHARPTALRCRQHLHRRRHSAGTSVHRKPAGGSDGTLRIDAGKDPRRHREKYHCRADHH